MDVDFALIGHQESWQAAADVIAVLRGSGLAPIPHDEIRDILPWIPPRIVCHVELASITGDTARGVYIDSFIPPDRLEAAHLHENLARVRAAAACAIDLAVITFAVLWPKGFGWSHGGYEFLLMWTLIMFAITLGGGGPYSLDRLIGREL